MKFNNKIIDYQFENKIKDIYDLDLSEEEETIKIINNPKDFYINEITQKFNKIMEDLINSQHFKKLNDFYQAEVEKIKIMKITKMRMRMRMIMIMIMIMIMRMRMIMIMIMIMMIIYIKMK